MLKPREKIILATLKRKARKEVVNKRGLNKKDLNSIASYLRELKDICQKNPDLQYGIVQDAGRLLVVCAKSNQSQMIDLVLKEFEEVKDLNPNYHTYNTKKDNFFIEWLIDTDKFSDLKNPNASWEATFILLNEYFSSEFEQSQKLRNKVLENMVLGVPWLTGGEKKMLKSAYYKQQLELVELFVQNYECQLGDENNFLSKMKTREIWDVLETYRVPILLSKEHLLRSATGLFDDGIVQDENLSGTIYLNGADTVIKLKPLLKDLDWEVDDFLLCVAFAESQQVCMPNVLFSAQRYVYQYFKDKGLNVQDLSYRDGKGELNLVANDLKTIALDPDVKLNIQLQQGIKSVKPKSDVSLIPPTPRF